MDDLISRQAAIEVLAEMQGRCITKEALIQNSKIWQQIKDLPSAEMVGKWIGSDDFDEYYRCSECGKGETQFGRLYRYCPWCGARLIGEEDE